MNFRQTFFYNFLLKNVNVRLILSYAFPFLYVNICSFILLTTFFIKSSTLFFRRLWRQNIFHISSRHPPPPPDKKKSPVQWLPGYISIVDNAWNRSNKYKWIHILALLSRSYQHLYVVVVPPSVMKSSKCCICKMFLSAFTAGALYASWFRWLTITHLASLTFYHSPRVTDLLSLT